MSKTIYYACKYAPLELFAGYGATFSALDPLAESFSCAERCAHANLCGYAKAVLEQVEQSGIRALVLTNCCDAMLRVYDVLAASGKMEFLQLLPVPHQSTPATRARFARDLRRLADALQRYTGQEFDAQRAHAFFVHKPHAEGPHLTLLGAHGGSVLYDTVQKAFALPVVDATCTGNRELADVAPAALEDFLPGYAAALLGQIPCMRMDAPVSERAALVDGQTVGIVYHTVQFCDYYAPGLTAPEQFHLPVLKIETDCSRQTFTSGGGQLSTRLGAFAESLNAVPDTENKEAPAMNTNAQYAAGIDSGSASTDAVILDRSGKICGWAIVPTGAGAATGARQALEQALTMAGIAESDLGSKVYTGYGREFLGDDGAAVTEITCHARGAHHLDPAVRTVIDIGGQDSKVIRLSESGAVETFAMNDKCAAGTGRFFGDDGPHPADEAAGDERAWPGLAQRCDHFQHVYRVCGKRGRQPDCPQHRTGGYHPRPEQICCGQNRCPGPPHRRRGPLYDDRRCSPQPRRCERAGNRPESPGGGQRVQPTVRQPGRSAVCAGKNGRKAVKPPVRKVLALSRTFVYTRVYHIKIA